MPDHGGRVRRRLGEGPPQRAAIFSCHDHQCVSPSGPQPVTASQMSWADGFQVSVRRPEPAARHHRAAPLPAPHRPQRDGPRPSPAARRRATAPRSSTSSRQRRPGRAAGGRAPRRRPPCRRLVPPGEGLLEVVPQAAAAVLADRVRVLAVAERGGGPGRGGERVRAPSSWGWTAWVTSRRRRPAASGNGSNLPCGGRATVVVCSATVPPSARFCGQTRRWERILMNSTGCRNGPVAVPSAWTVRRTRAPALE